MLKLICVCELRRLSVVLSASLIVLSLLTATSHSGPLPSINLSHSTDGCQGARIPDDVFVIVKTGACEDRRKLEAHLQTTLRCVPSWTIFSDLEESVYDNHFGFTQLHDSFQESIEDEHLATVDEFKLYQKLAQHGSCTGLSDDDLYVPNLQNNNNGNPKSRGWNLDKWKFLSIPEKAFLMRPDAAWYLIIETDTLHVWENFLRLLKQLDPTKDHYIGNQMYIGPQIFAHGGGGLLFSNSAMRKLVSHIQENRTELQEYTKGHWAGDAVLGKVMIDIDIPLMWNWPYNIVESVTQLKLEDENYGGKRLWCSAVVSYHHMTAEETIDFWSFKNEWFKQNPDQILRHRDVFYEYLLPQVHETKVIWDNLSDETEGSLSHLENVEQCRGVCISRSDCVQYSFAQRVCRLRRDFKLGHRIGEQEAPMESGWLVDRVKDHVARFKPCSEQDGAWRHGYYGFS